MEDLHEDHESLLETPAAPAPADEAPAAELEELAPVAFVLPESIRADEDENELPLLSLTLAVGGRSVRLEAGQPYMTSDPDEINALDAQEHVARDQEL